MTPQITVRLEVPLPDVHAEVLTLLDRLGQPVTARVDGGLVVIETGAAPVEPEPPAEAHRCDECGKTFPKAHGLAVHQRRSHRTAETPKAMAPRITQAPPVPPPPQRYCEVCEARFDTRADLARHRLDAGHHTEDAA